ncbi:cytochrome P450 [Dendrothele bispora CBS 962.96]|uniref:Cytochrome P450 n=1 Tax=Dendrothele bispora (strain CBS 962.96) TaxID=1314807 RepID=A0A4S8M4X6_DENBC|nr:cytochrome P450 [Dendrothele bispora CBS 962.96]
MPKEKDWVVFSKWGDTYGTSLSLPILIFGMTFIIINSPSTALSILEHQNSKTSDRPIVPMASDLVGWKNTTGFMPYGDTMRNHRRLQHRLLGTPAACKAFHSHVELEMHRFLKRLLADPESKRLKEHIRKTAGSIILRISHGYQVQETNDPFVDLAEKAVQQLVQAINPATFFVNVVPALRHLPEWFPGGSFQKTAREWAATLDDLAGKPFAFVKSQMAAGTAIPSYTSKLLDSDRTLSAEEETDIKWSASSLYGAGVDTTYAIIYTFFKVMILYPEVQAKAKAEIDQVVGNQRLPCMEDRKHLPYINAIVLELYRWHIVLPTAIPHRSTEDLIYNNYFIPKGSIILPNVWKMTHDPTIYHSPMTFKPERFTQPEPERDPRQFMFGFGRRICAGRHLADVSIFLACARVLSVFDITKYRDENGEAVMPDTEVTSGISSYPSDFGCTIFPRSENAGVLVQAELAG